MPAEAPEIVHDVLRSPGQPLDADTRSFMEGRFGHDFSHVRIHADERSALAAQSVYATAYTVGRDVVFDAGKYAPTTQAGRHLLAHELAHVVQQGAVGSTHVPRTSTLPLTTQRSDAAETEANSVATGIMRGQPIAASIGQRGLALQRQASDEEERLRLPGGPILPRYQLHLDPEIEARLWAMRQTQLLLSPETIRLSLQNLDFSSITGTQPPPWLSTPSVPTPGPLVPQGAGPSEPRPATAGDLLGAVMRIPAVDAALTTLRTRASDQVSRDWRALSGGERAAVITQGVVIGAGALTGVLSDPAARGFLLGQLQNRTLPVPGVPGLTFQFNATGPNQLLRFDLNVGALLPRSWGFK